MSSRLFQKVREELGAAYSVYAYPSMYYQAGALVIYAGISAEKTELVKQAILREVRGLRENGISEEELEHTKTQITGQLYYGAGKYFCQNESVGQECIAAGADYSGRRNVGKRTECHFERYAKAY